MCIIIAKPAGVKMLDDATIRRCFAKNPDGAGYMFVNSKGKVCINKGFSTSDALLKSLDTLGDLTDRAVIIHCRIGTSGGKGAAQCHPFPVSDNPDMLKASRLKTDFAVAHNGMIGAGKGDMSDTMLFIQDAIYPIRNALLKGDQKDAVIKLFDYAIRSNKFAFLTGGDAPEISVYGEGWVEDNGLYYSNSGYRQYISTVTTYHSKAWDDYRKYDDYDYGYGYGDGFSSAKDSQSRTDANDDAMLDLFGERYACPACCSEGQMRAINYGEFECVECQAVFDRTGHVVLEGNLFV